MAPNGSHRTASAPTLPPKATLNSLPDELLYEIFDYLLDLPESPVYCCALVCRRWREPAQRALFSTVRILGRGRDAERWLASPARQRYPTRDLTFEGTMFLKPTTFLEIIAACSASVPGLSRLSFCVRGLGGGVYQYFQSDSAKNIQSAHIGHLGDFPPSAVPLPCRLEDLTFGISMGEDVSEHTLKCLLLSSRDTLRRLTLIGGSDATDTSLVALLSANPFANLTTLDMGTRSGLSQFTLLEVIPTLKSLIIGTMYLSDLSYGLSLVGTVAGLEITSLTIGMIHSYERDAHSLNISFLLQIVRLPLFARLSRLVLPEVRKSKLEVGQGLDLLDECKKRSIDLKCRHGYLSREMIGANEPPSASFEYEVDKWTHDFYETVVWTNSWY